MQFQRPRKICRMQGCSQLLPAERVICDRCSSEILADNSLKVCIIQAGRRRETLIRTLLQGTAIRNMHRLQNLIISYVLNDLGRLNPNAKWKYILDTNGILYVSAAAA